MSTLNSSPKGSIGVQRDDPVGQNDRLVHIVGDQDTGFLVGFPDVFDLIRQIGAGQRVQRRQRFVQQQNLGAHRQGTGDVHTLAHTTRQFGRTARGRVRQANHLDVVINLFLFLLGRKIGEDRVHGQTHVAVHRQPRHQRVVLEDHATLWARTGDRLAFERDLALGGRL